MAIWPSAPGNIGTRLRRAEARKAIPGAPPQHNWVRSPASGASAGLVAKRAPACSKGVQRRATQVPRAREPGKLDGLGIKPARRGRLIEGVSFDLAMKFLETYRSDQRDLISGKLLEYIRLEASRADQPYDTWNIAIVETGGTRPSVEPLGAFGNVGLVNRARLRGLTRDGLADIKAPMSRDDVLMDVTGSPDDRSWDSVKEFRQALVGDRIPLLLLYAIDEASVPRSEKLREPLGAVRDMLGIGLVLPERGAKTSYVRVPINQDDGDEEDVQADIDSDAGQAAT